MKIETKLFLSRAVFFAALLNFAVFWVVAVRLGGDAVNGRMQDGHFYLASHGKYTEVSGRVFMYSRLHTYSVWVTHPLALLAVAWGRRLEQQAG
jgi:hypothetical protein